MEVSPGVYDTISVGASQLLLDGQFADASPLIVLEGAPGQGKSTLAQYVAQVHRARILGKQETVDRLTHEAKASAVWLPIKIELRDLAAWVRGVDPWAGPQPPSHGSPRTLEAALAAHIARFSGGVDFSVADVQELLAGETSVLLLLDALDEVADLNDRRLVVEEVVDAVDRLQQVAGRIRIVVTSRPTAIANAPAFPRTRFNYLSLGAITPKLALDYTHRWAQVRRLEEADEQELSSLLTAKLDQEHMQELAKNTMQLSILLSLLHLRGASLPDKRTELYDTYIEVFLNREAEKAPIVRDNRELLVDIHRFLGFHLHATAESGQNQGRISTTDLRALLVQYLEAEGHPLSLVDELLTGVVERVVALVSRVEGTYEFEVQPLREYFAARHLYDTAPYSPTGRERPDTKPDRFDAVAPNSYWLNTTRFFAGCFSKGELADLADRLCSLVGRNELRFTGYGRSLTGALLQDLVFTQSPRATERVVAACFDDLGLRWGGMRDSPIRPDVFNRGPVQLSAATGAKDLAARIKPRLAADRDTERAQDLATLLRINGEPMDLAEWWKNEFYSRPIDRRTDWLRVGHWLSILRYVDLGMLLPLPEATPEQREEELAILCRADVIPDTAPDGLISECLSALLNNRMGRLAGSHLPVRTSLGTLDRFVRSSLSARMMYRADFVYTMPSNSKMGTTATERMQEIADVVAVIREVHESEELGRSLEPWRRLIAAIERLSGGFSMLALEWACTSAAVRSPSERGGGAQDLFDAARTLADRMRHARRRGGQPAWWATTAQRVASQEDALVWFAALATWGDAETVTAVAEPLETVVQAIPTTFDDSLSSLSYRAGSFSPKARQLIKGDLSAQSLRVRRLLMGRLAFDSRSGLVRELAAKHSMTTSLATEILGILDAEVHTEPSSLVANLRLIRQCHEAGGRYGMGQGPPILMRWLASESGSRLAAEVLADPWQVPGGLLVLCETAVSRRSPRAPHVLTIAKRDGWWAAT